MNSRKMMNNCRRRGEWTELQFMAKAAKFGLRLSKPWGELSRYDIAIETAGHFIRVQIKSTINRVPQGCYMCAVKPNCASKPYQPGEFDFLAVYIITEDVWYIIPAKLVVHGKRGGIRLYPGSPTSKSTL